MVEQRLDEWKDWPLDLTEIVAALSRREVDFIIIGGYAALVHGLPLPTYDLDIVIAPGSRNRGRLLIAMSDLTALALIDQPESDEPLSAEDALAAGRDVSFFTPHGYLDVVADPAGVGGYRALRRGSQLAEVTDGVEARVAALRDIIASKMALGRDRDLTKLPALETVAELA